MPICNSLPHLRHFYNKTIYTYQLIFFIGLKRLFYVFFIFFVIILFNIYIYRKIIMAKISFDFDGVLTTLKGFNLIQEMIKNGNEIFIITARRLSVDVLDLARKLNIPSDHVYFTSGFDKWETIKKLKIDIHYDNNQEQIDKINQNTNSKGIIFKS